MMHDMCLERGGEAGSMGMVSKSYDKYGKRMHKADSKKVDGKLNQTHSMPNHRMPVFSK